jgi:hypothetical protein
MLDVGVTDRDDQAEVADERPKGDTVLENGAVEGVGMNPKTQI